MAASETVEVDGRRLRLSNLDKVLYPASGTTKGEVLQYLAQIAPVLVPHAANRPATRKRWPDGVEGQMFFQKNLDASTPDWVKRRSIQHRSGTNEYALVNDLATLTWLGQTATLEIHVPQWQFGRTGVAHNPDRLVLDLDPGPGAGLQECAQVALWARDVLVGMGLDPLPVTSGSKGIHLYAALDGKQDSDAVSAVAKELARYLEAEHPDLVVSDMKKSLREGKVLVDWSQNNSAKTTIAPYSLRGREHPTVAAPRAWEELEDPGLRHLEYPEVLERVERDGDLLAGLTAGHLAQLEPTPERMATFDRLAVYRSKRDASRTPEPVPDAGRPRSGTTSAPAAHGRAPTFVIQEHHARRLHWDFRLEHDGVLVSWALPKGEPTDPGKNHLAVQTEDHPIEYGSFEGSIPQGEYGAGEVTIWDAGTYDLEKWRDDEVIATLHSPERGSRRLALIRTGGRGGDDENSWLIHRTKDQPRGAADPADRASPAAPEASPDEGGSPGQDKRPPPRPQAASPSGTLAAKARDLRPMLATAPSGGDLPRGGDDWAFEMKWDGFRALAVVEGGEVRLISRSGQDLTVTFPELSALAGMVDGDAVLDGEIVALDKDGRPVFGRLQQRANLRRAGDVERARRRVAVDLMLFDVLEAGGRSFVGEPYDARRAELERLVDVRPPVHLPPAFDGDLDAALATSRELRLEGVVAKRRRSTYAPGRRSREWLKIKHEQTQEVIVVGWRPLRSAGGRTDDRRAGGLLLAVPTAPETPDEDATVLRFVGRVGTGFTDKDRREVVSRLTALERKTPPVDDVPRVDAADARWVTPKLVGEVAYTEWTDGGAGRLRHPVWRGWRPDKSADEVAVET
ncbi:ATP-dependent DNA ligase [Antribacter gilvus]|uniref:ATP-dependent DNA ligase n=1 Tax=Antribacter gilvus TaxID=2304675 RepID=UPI000F791A51|nr:ATP-dependent DNA ligase [Antribacter gilvus]